MNIFKNILLLVICSISVNLMAQAPKKLKTKRPQNIRNELKEYLYCDVCKLSDFPLLNQFGAKIFSLIDFNQALFNMPKSEQNYIRFKIEKDYDKYLANPAQAMVLVENRPDSAKLLSKDDYVKQYYEKTIELREFHLLNIVYLHKENNNVAQDIWEQVGDKYDEKDFINYQKK